MLKFEHKIKKLIKNLRTKYKRAQIKSPDFSDLKTAQELLATMSLGTAEDYFLFLSCVVLLSSSNKQYSNRKFKHYYFKKYVQEAIDCAIYHKEKFLTFFQTKDSNGEEITYITVCGFQFAFHNVGESPKMQRARLERMPQYKEQKWDYFPAQKYSTELFNFAISQNKNLSGIYFGGSGELPKQIAIQNKRKPVISKDRTMEL